MKIKAAQQYRRRKWMRRHLWNIVACGIAGFILGISIAASI